MQVNLMHKQCKGIPLISFIMIGIKDIYIILYDKFIYQSDAPQ